MNVKNRTVEWKRMDINAIVHVYRHRKDDGALQVEQYRGRTTLDYEDLSRGILTLRISSTQLSDSGKYRCSVPRQSASFITLQVKNPQDMNRKDEFSTVRPQLENVTLPNNPDAERKDVGGVVVGVCEGLIVLSVFALLVKREHIKKCWRPGRETQPDVEKENDLQLKPLTSSGMKGVKSEGTNQSSAS